jgi:NAD+-dependent protein deacetylase sirtuin 4
MRRDKAQNARVACCVPDVVIDTTPKERTMHTLDDLARLVAGRKLAVLTGAGCSTESGIPDYRGPETRKRARNPILYNEFMGGELTRARYWARSMVGWRRMGGAQPNAAHHALATMEAAGACVGLITQNVDGLHGRAGSKRLVELHGAIARVRCMSCQARSERAALQERLEAMNPDWAHLDAASAPDGDAELELARFEELRVPGCEACGGILKPDVVFFGENVPRPVVDQAWAILDDAQALLVVGSSLTVYSGYRFVREARQRAMPIGILNMGETRGDPEADVRVDASAGEALPRLVASLLPGVAL